MANLLSNTTVGGNSVITTANIGSYAVTSLSGYATQSWVQSQGYVTGGPYLSLSGGSMSGDIIFPNNTAVALKNADGSAGFRPDDLYGNTYTWNTSGGYYVDANSYYFRSTGSINWMTISGGTVQASADFRAPIFYDSNDTNYYGDFASTSRFNIAHVNSVVDQSYSRIVNPQGAQSLNNSPQSGSIKIKLPVAASFSNSMMSFTIQIYNYSTGTSRTIRCGGYTYYTTDWYNTFAFQIGDTEAGNLTIRFGKDSTGACVWIGETNSYWDYPNVFVTDVQSGHSQPTSMATGWSIAIVTSFDTVQTSRVAYSQITSGNIGSQSVSYATTAGALSSMNISQFSNNSGYLTGITSGQVTGALGYTPYNSSNPNGYITSSGSISGNAATATTANALTSMNISQFTNNSGYLTSLPSHNHDDRYYTESEIDSQIGTRLYQSSGVVIDVNAFNSTGLYRGSTGSWTNRPTITDNSGALLQIDTHPGNYHTQLFFDSSGTRLYLRSAIAGSWNSWVTMLHSGNHTLYSPSLTGSGASGTWNINVTGSAGSASTATTATNLYGAGGSNIRSSTPGTSYQYSYQVREKDGGYGNSTIDYAPQLAFHWGNVVASSILMEASGRMSIRNNPGTGYENFIAAVIYSSGYGDSTQWNTAYGWGNHASAGYQAASTAINTGNIGSQSVSYATTAGTANAVAWGNVSSKPSLLMYYQGFTLDANTMDGNSTGFTYSVNAPYTGPIARFSETGYSLQLNAAYSGSGTGIAFRTRNGDAGSFNPWRVLLNDANYTAYSPSLAGTGASGTWGINVTGSAGSVAWTNVSSRPTALSQFTNDLGNYGGWITGITSGNVTTALGFTPYNSTNPNGYITSSASISGSSGSVSGLTLTSSANGINPDSVTQNQIGYNTSVSLFGQTDGGLYSSAFSSAWIHQIYGDFRTGQIAVRGKNSGSWQSWRTVLDSGNYTSYSPSLTGSGASGTWGISVTGNAGTVGGYAVSGTVGANTVVIRDVNGYIYAHYINSNVSETENPTINSFYTSNGDGWLRKSSVAHVKSQLGLGSLAYSSATIPTNTNQLTNGAGYITSSGSISGNAATATNVAWTGVTGRPTALSQFSNDLGNYGGFLTSLPAHDHDRVFLTDSRGAVREPSYYDDRYAQWDFQNNGDTNAGGDAWHGLLTVSKWTVYDASHRQEQLAFTGDDLKRRTATSDSAWGPWKTILDSNNFSTWAAAASHTHSIANVTGLQTALDGKQASGSYLTTSGKAADSELFDGTDSIYFVKGNGVNTLGYRTTGNSGANSAGGLSSGFYDGSGMSNMPTSDWYHLIVNAHHNSSTSNQYEFHIATPFWDKSNFYVRSISPGDVGPWRTLIHNGNIGSQSVSYASTAGSASTATTATTATVASQLNKFGDIYGQNWNTYYVQDKLIAAAVYGHSGANRPNLTYDYGVALSYGEATGPLLQMYFPENSGNIGTIFRKGTYRTGWNGNWSTWKTLVEQEGNLCTIVGGNGTGLEVHGNVGYNQDPLTYFLIRGQADTSWKAVKIRLTGDAGGQDIEFRRIAENGADSRMWYVPRGGNTVNFEYPIVQPSDSRLKDNITPISTPVEKIKALSGVEFDWNSGEQVGTHDVGLIAQDVEAVLPEAVTTQEDGYKNLAYTKVIPLLVEAMKEQQTMIEALRAEIELLKNK